MSLWKANPLLNMKYRKWQVMNGCILSVACPWWLGSLTVGWGAGRLFPSHSGTPWHVLCAQGHFTLLRSDYWEVTQ
jgi:hypothetical protein